ncbi:sensor histidine kinase [Pullulanibacillus sp. KACC 23026]|uniref:HAMP domain-containing sensor histidine kinase n=1 Tax=Pullulanibacillus sp. KACC 23026 TaxID=3028315 RepID=UPI0023B1D414|nr:sensor histidine kinase [Pullulanibacillus sp. KACC 23026]WEG13028.1 sensor histidine kinase [Pullulanibacillus sp. KACC 23026]
MKGKRLVNIQWRFIRYSIWMCAVCTLLTIGILMSLGHLSFKDFWEEKLYGLPMVIWLLFEFLCLGFIFGYTYGNLLKKRLEQLVSAILYFERGTFSYRVPDLGEDEVGQVGGHLNQMAGKIEAQVAALQKLSSEKASWNTEMKRHAVNEERQRLARELHDAVSQHLFAISMLSSAVRETLRRDVDASEKQIETIEKLAGMAQNEMRALLLHLRPAHLEGKPLKQGIEELLKEFAAKQMISIKWEVEDVRGLPKGVEDHLFRIVQEGLSNILRHAKASSVQLRLNRVNQQLYLKIIDDGVGFRPENRKASSYGLSSIEERVTEIGGVFEIVSLPGKGTQIEVKVPIIEGIGEEDGT